jgi:hypothetical protein
MIMNWMNILERAGWTFLEAFLVALPTTISADMDGAAWKALLLSAACAGLSAVKSFIIEVIKRRNSESDEMYFSAENEK